MEKILGMVGGKPSRVRPLILRQNGIRQRHYALDERGQPTHSNAEMAALAVRRLFDRPEDMKQVSLLTAGTGSMDMLVPSLASMIHGELGSHALEIHSTQGTCCSGIQGLKYAMAALSAGFHDQAVSLGSERASAYIRADRFHGEIQEKEDIETHPYLAFEKDFLRWMLSDGAGAAWLTRVPLPEGPCLRVDWIDILSFAHELDTCMYIGAQKTSDNRMKGFHDLEPETWTSDSVFSIRQDTRLLGEHIVRKGGEFLSEIMDRRQFGPDQVDYFLPHLSSLFFRSQIQEYQARIGREIPMEKWYSNLPEVGNVGAASPFLLLEGLMTTARLKAGDRVLVMVPESARFTYAYIHLTVIVDGKAS